MEIFNSAISLSWVVFAVKGLYKPTIIGVNIFDRYWFCEG